jgi:GrpB-like predicted nucleotidyltransferase (UPF0157 family)
MVLGLKRGSVELADYDPEWAKVAANFIKTLWDIFESKAKDIQHFGSTAIIGIRAKPIIDIAVGIQNLDILNEILPRLETKGIDKSSGQPFENVVLFSFDERESGKRIFNIPIVEHNSIEWQNYICFRDYMNKCPEKAMAYNKLKYDLSKQHPNDIIAYMNGKKQFVEDCIVESKVFLKFATSQYKQFPKQR